MAAVFTFIVRQSNGSWTAKQHGGGAGALEATSASTSELQRKLTSLAMLASAGAGTVSSSFTLITPTSAIAQVIVTGTAAAVIAASTAAADIAAVPPVESGPPEVDKEEEDSDDDNIGDIFGCSLWD